MYGSLSLPDKDHHESMPPTLQLYLQVHLLEHLAQPSPYYILHLLVQAIVASAESTCLSHLFPKSSHRESTVLQFHDFVCNF